jgi:spermidine/putrescine-binding protein
MGADDRQASRRKILKTFGAGVGLAGLAGCTGATGGDGGGSTSSGSGGSSGGGDSSGGSSGGGSSATLRIAGGGGSWGEARQNAFTEPFKNGEIAWDKEHKVSYTSAASEKYMSELQRSPKQPAYDAIELDGQRAAILGEIDAVSKQSDIEGWDDIPSAYKNEYMGGTVAFPRGIAARADMTDKTFETWDDLIDPDLKGKVGFEPWANAGSKYFYVINKKEGGSLDNIEPGLEWLREFVEVTDPVVFDQIDQAMKLFQNGDMVVAPFLSARTENLEIDEGLDMEFTVPEAGAPMDFWGYPITKHNDDAHHAVAREYARGCLHPEVQATFAEEFGYPPCAPDAAEFISEEAKENHPMMNPSDEQLERYDVGIDWVQAAKQSNADGERFRKVLAGG